MKNYLHREKHCLFRKQEENRNPPRDSPLDPNSPVEMSFEESGEQMPSHVNKEPETRFQHAAFRENENHTKRERNLNIPTHINM